MTTVTETKEEKATMNWDHLYTEERAFGDSPLVLEATVVHGFKRGSKELGIPTANLSMEELGDVGEGLDTGIYYGFAKLCGDKHKESPLHQAVISVGWNPFYKVSVLDDHTHPSAFFELCVNLPLTQSMPRIF